MRVSYANSISHYKDKFAIFCVVLFGVLLAHQVWAQRSLPDDNLSYPVLLTFEDGSSGSGFFLNTSGATYLVTARHVLFKAKTLTSNPVQTDPWEVREPKVQVRAYSKDVADSTPTVFVLDLELLAKEGQIEHKIDRDVAVVHVANIAINSISSQKTLQVVNGVQILQSAKFGVTGVSLENLKTFDQTLVGNEILVFGYPSSLGLRNTPQLEYDRPLLRKGIIAGKNISARTLILDCSVYPGNSGGPVVEIDHEGFQSSFKVIGVVIEYIPFNQITSSETVGLQILSNSGYSVVSPIDDVLDLVHILENHSPASGSNK